MITHFKGRWPNKRLRQRIQMIFQDPYESLNPTQTIEETVAETLVVHGLERSAKTRQAREILQALDREVELVLYPDEGHIFLDVENVVDSELRRVEFLARALEEK